MANYLPGYGAVPPNTPSIGVIAQPNPYALQINSNNNEATITITNDGEIITKAGTIKIDELISIANLLKKLVIDVSKDDELTEKYPYVRELAHTWLMKELTK